MRLKQALNWIFAPVLAHRQAWLAINVLYFGTIVLGAVYTAFDPGLHQALLAAVGEAFSPAGSLGPLVSAYQQGDLLAAIVGTFLVNLFLGSIVYIGLPSLFIPFAGLAVGVLRATLWGLLFSPFGNVFGLALIPHLLTILIEGEAYVIAMLGTWLWWWPVFTSPGRRWQAWLDGLRLQGRIYLAVALVLAVAAIYEVLEVVLLVPRLAG